MKNVKKSAVIISALLLVCAILFTGCPNASGGTKPPAGSAGSSGGSSGGTGSGGGSSGGGSGGSGSGGSGGGSLGGGGGGSTGGTVRLTIRGDERIDIAASGSIDVDKGKTWAEVNNAVTKKAVLQNEWPADEYSVYEWRLTDENGVPVADGYTFTENTTVYAVTNYTKFKIENGIVKGYMGDKPKGKIIIPAGITEIAKGAFYECMELTQVRFPKSLKKIADATDYVGAFRMCTELHTADFSACTELTEIGSSSFSECTGLTAANLSSCTKLERIEDDVFFRCRLTETFNLPAKLEYIGARAFYGCTGLKKIDFPASIDLIKKNAFKGCTEVTVFDLYKCTKTSLYISEGAFSDCNKARFTVKEGSRVKKN